MRTSHLTQLNEKALLKAIEIEGWPQALCRQSVFARFYCSCSLSLSLLLLLGWMNSSAQPDDSRVPKGVAGLPLPLFSRWGGRLMTKNIAKGTTNLRVEFISQVQTKILIKFHLQNLDQGSTSKSQPNVSLSIKLKLQIVANTILISNSYNINKFGVGIFTRQGDINQVY